MARNNRIFDALSRVPNRNSIGMPGLGRKLQGITPVEGYGPKVDAGWTNQGSENWWNPDAESSVEYDFNKGGPEVGSDTSYNETLGGDGQTGSAGDIDYGSMFTGGMYGTEDFDSLEDFGLDPDSEYDFWCFDAWQSSGYSDSYEDFSNAMCP